MSSPYTYSPPQYQYNAYTAAGSPPNAYSPFIPDASLYSYSPFHHPASLPPSPNHHSIGLPPPSPPHNYLSLDPSGYSRTRTTSFHGYIEPSSPFLKPEVFIPPPPSTIGSAAGHGRRHSFSAVGGQSAAGPFPIGWPSVSGPSSHALSPFSVTNVSEIPTPVYLHPWLNGEAPRADFYFNMANPYFLPHKILGPGKSVLLGREELTQPATHPAVSKMKIVVDKLPQWPIELSYNPYADDNVGFLNVPGTQPSNLPPITLGDVLSQVHRQLHARISHTDWDKLSKRDQSFVTKAYARRCASLGVGETSARSEGVKRIDFLVDRITFRGLVRSGHPDLYTLITG